MALLQQSQPFLEPGRDSFDVELSDFDGRHDDRTPDNHYSNPKPAAQAKNSPWLIAAALAITVLGFVINTESTEYFETELGWRKPFATLYLTHTSLALPWLCYTLYSRFSQRGVTYRAWVRDYNNSLREAISTIDAYTTDGPWMVYKFKGRVGGPLDFLLTTMAVLTVVLTMSGASWFVALAWTTPADLTAIYNCSTFFAAAFSVPLLKERLGKYSIVAVALSIVGTFVIAYGDTTAVHDPGDKVGTSRLFGNIIASVGALAFGLYEVLFKKWACSSQPMGPKQSLPLTLTASALTGFYTLSVGWVVLILLHIFGIETMVWPSGEVWLYIIIAVLSGSTDSKHVTIDEFERTPRQLAHLGAFVGKRANSKRQRALSPLVTKDLRPLQLLTKQQQTGHDLKGRLYNMSSIPAATHSLSNRTAMSDKRRVQLAQDGETLLEYIKSSIQEPEGDDIQPSLVKALRDPAFAALTQEDRCAAIECAIGELKQARIEWCDVQNVPSDDWAARSMSKEEDEVVSKAQELLMKGTMDWATFKGMVLRLVEARVKPKEEEKVVFEGRDGGGRGEESSRS
ncbi:hypothetical protein LTR97_007444 [Elasticomyces elasticus]|uniref:EamA domain-containing protein n=1 Tax=Elasticomyces elasticus TaxID=574655 RepID=A0AAN7W4V0_9PEZI|nr:hypothetical protein LTR97_007444 [Elasticomyces elasticus]